MKILVLTTNTGGGHNSAARAVMEAFRQLGCSVSLEDSLALINRRASHITEATYVSIVRHVPGVFGFLYKAGRLISTPKHKSVVYLANTIGVKKLYDYILQYNPDAIITSHLFCAHELTYIKRNLGSLPYTAGIMTDYTCQPFWEDTELDEYFTPHESLTYLFVAHGISRDKLRPYGIPVSPACSKRLPLGEAKARYGYNGNVPHVMLIGGSMGAGKLDVVADSLINSLNGVQVTVVCGSNQKLYERLRYRYRGNSNIYIKGLVSPLYPLMDTADIILAKAGGLTSTEVITKCIPYVVVNPINGVETENSEYLSSHGLALYAADVETAVTYTKKLLRDEKLRRDMMAAQLTGVQRDSGVRIAQYVIGHLRKS